MSDLHSGTILERLTRIETLMSNHLHHHETFRNKVIYPVLVSILISVPGILFLVFKSIISGA